MHSLSTMNILHLIYHRTLCLQFLPLTPPPNTLVNPNKKLSKLTYPNTPTFNNIIPIPQLPDYETNFRLKFHPQFGYYTDGSFKKPKSISFGV